MCGEVLENCLKSEYARVYTPSSEIAERVEIPNRAPKKGPTDLSRTARYSVARPGEVPGWPIADTQGSRLGFPVTESERRSFGQLPTS